MIDALYHFFLYLFTTDPHMVHACVFGLLGGLGGAGGLVSSAFGAMGQVASFQAQQQQADAMRQQQQQYIKDRQEALRLQQESIRSRQAQEQESEARKRVDVGLKTRQAKSRALAAAAQGGVGGASIDALLQDFEFQNAAYDSASLARQRAADQQADLQARSANAQFTFDMHRNLKPIEEPSFGAAALRIGQSLFSNLG